MKFVSLLFSISVLAYSNAEVSSSGAFSKHPNTTKNISNEGFTNLKSNKSISQRAIAQKSVVDLSSGDFVWIPEFKAYYSFRQKKSYADAVKACSGEGGELFYPKSLSESKAVIDGIKVEGVKQILLGMRDRRPNENFLTVAGDPIPYSHWQADECVALRFGDATFANVDCDSRERFVCRKSAPLDQGRFYSNDICGTNDSGYFYKPEFKSCYKQHSERKKWPEAFAICQAEKASLPIARSEEEAAFIIADFSTTLMGFHDLFVNSWYLTIDGKPLEDSGYAKWMKGEPNNYGAGEHCGHIRPGGLVDIPCDLEYTFICKKSLN